MDTSCPNCGLDPCMCHEFGKIPDIGFSFGDDKVSVKRVLCTKTIYNRWKDHYGPGKDAEYCEFREGNHYYIIDEDESNIYIKGHEVGRFAMGKLDPTKKKGEQSYCFYDYFKLD